MKIDEEISKIHSENTGKLSINGTISVRSKDDLSKVYSPGVAQISQAIYEDPSLLKKYTIAGKMVAVISNGTAVLGLGNIGAKAALPVMEGKCLIFKEFAGIDAFPICIDETDTKKVIEIIKSISLNFAAINLEDFKAPECFEIEDTLSRELDMPIMHDDQHGTAIVTLAGLMGALELTKKKKIKIVINGAGAAGKAIFDLIMSQSKELSISEICVLDSKGLISSDREFSEQYKVEIAKSSHQSKTKQLNEVIKGADVFIGVSVANILTQEMVKSMNSDPIIFGLANPNPEIDPKLAKEAGASIIATGRSDYPNQVNNALVYPGVFKGLIENRISKVTNDIKILVAKVIFEYHKPNLSNENILPSILDKNIPIVISNSIKELFSKSN